MIKKRIQKINNFEESKKTKFDKKENLHLSVYDIEGNEISKISIDKKIISLKNNDKLIAQAVRVYLANQRQGTASTKDRGEVSGSTRKIYRQKGTGRARHGSIKAPIFVGGGIVGGPKPKDYSLKLNKKQKKQVFILSLSYKLRNRDVILISDKLLKDNNLKTKLIASFLERMNILDKKNLFVLPNLKNNFYKSLKNISNTFITNYKSINFYQIFNSEKIIFFNSSFEEIKNKFLKTKN